MNFRRLLLLLSPNRFDTLPAAAETQRRKKRKMLAFSALGIPSSLRRREAFLQLPLLSAPPQLSWPQTAYRWPPSSPRRSLRQLPLPPRIFHRPFCWTIRRIIEIIGRNAPQNPIFFFLYRILECDFCAFRVTSSRRACLDLTFFYLNRRQR